MAKKAKRPAPQPVPAEPTAVEPGTKPEGKLPDKILRDFDVREWKHATAILQTDFPDELRDIVAVLSSLLVRRSHITVGGGGKSRVTQAIDSEFKRRGWIEKKWDTKIVVDNTSSESPTHKVDCYKNRVALELEWNNKDPFFDRDLNNFRLLFYSRAIGPSEMYPKCARSKIDFTEARQCGTLLSRSGDVW